jgi:VIT1/CCC1 family predicted Fe2+/Mn2+ transporter
VLSISSLVLGVAAAHASQRGIIVATVAGLVAGVFSMGAGEYISVASQADTERADLEMERRALQDEYELEHAELTSIYIQRGLDPELANRVSTQLMAFDALGAHARDDIGISGALSARPLLAAVASAISFAIGGVVPFLVAVVAQGRPLVPSVALVSLAFLLALGAAAARVGGAPMITGATRVLIWGALAMGITYGVGALFGSITPM